MTILLFPLVLVAVWLVVGIIDLIAEERLSR